MGINKFTILTAVLLSFTLGSARVSAHEFLSETAGKGGGILHISPGDDPAAGEESHAYYEIKTDEDLAGATARITIKSVDGSVNKTQSATLKGTTASVEYTFPTRGAYFMTLYVELKNNKQLVLKSSLQISRGKGTSASQQPAPAWAKAGCVIAVWGAFVLAFSAIRHRKAILLNSK